MNEDSQFWFPARRYGWGWGPPSSWQGWLVLCAWAAVVGAAVLAYGPANPIPFAIVLVLATIALLAVCLVKGEPPSWRWGDRQ